MFEKVNPSHPDKIADRIAGAIVDLAYSQTEDPRIAVEVLIGHGTCRVVAETDTNISFVDIRAAVQRISRQEEIDVDYVRATQDEHLAGNQKGKFRCGDNGIFKGCPATREQKILSYYARQLYQKFPYDGKYILADSDFIICQSNAFKRDIMNVINEAFKIHNIKNAAVNPLGDWTGGTDVDTGATNRKLGSDMGDAVTGGGLHGKDLSKADVSVNIYAHIRAQQLNSEVEYHCAIGDEYVDGLPYGAIVEVARDYIRRIGGFEKFAEWGLI